MRNLLRILAFLLPILVTAQTNNDCYKLRFDMSGITDTSGVGLLKQNSCKLRNELSTDDQAKFQVQDAGFYMMTEFLASTSGNPYLDQFETLKGLTSKEFQYYVLVGRQTDSKGIYTKLYIDVNLPNATPNNCPDNFNQFAKTFLINKIEEEYNSKGRNFHDANYSIARGIGALADYIKDVKECCQQPNTDVIKCINCKNVDNISSYLGSLGFTKTSIQNIGNYPSYSPPISKAEIEDKAKLLFTVNDISVIDIPNTYKNMIDTFTSRGLKIKVLITTNDDLCSPNWDKMLQDAQSGDYHVFYWHHIHRAKQLGGHLLFTKVFYPKVPKFKGTEGNRAGPDPVTTLISGLGSAFADVMMQTLITHIVDGDPDWTTSISKVNWGSAVWSGVVGAAQNFVGLFPTNKALLNVTLATGSATSVVTYNAYVGKYSTLPNWQEVMIQDFSITFVANIIGIQVGSYISKSNLSSKLATIGIYNLKYTSYVNIAKLIGRKASEFTERFGVDKSLQHADELAGIFQNGIYLVNPTATNVKNLFANPSGSLTLTQGTQALNGKYMYIIDDLDNVIIGTRAKGSNFSTPDGKAPHPTLLGGADPKVQTAGMIDFRNGLIYSVDNTSGHFKPSAKSIEVAEYLFKQYFNAKSFANDFIGFKTF